LNMASYLQPAVEAAAPEARAAAKYAIVQRRLRWMRVKSGRNDWELQHRQPKQAQRGDQNRRTGQAESAPTQPSQQNRESCVGMWDSERRSSLGQKRKRWCWRQNYSGALQ
jgi:hypothetical protein